MAYILSGTWTTPNGIELSEAYCAVDEIINCKRKKEANVILKIYQSKEKADADPSKNQLQSISHVVKNIPEQGEGEEIVPASNDFDDYFSVRAMENDGNGFNLAYKYFNDKKPAVLDWDIWKSDEV